MGKQILKNKKVIVLSGFARGGTNIVWNILQSHPDIVAPPYETGEIFRRSISLRLLNMIRGWRGLPINPKIVDRILFRYKMESLRHADNRYRHEGVLYSPEQMEKSALCLKGVNDDILTTQLLTNVYPDLYFIGLARNGYSLADGYVRRGRAVRGIGRKYSRTAEKMKELSSSISRFKIVKFEEALRDPFEFARDLFAFVDVHPCELEKLRLKSKRVISTTGEHEVAFGREDRKYWFSRDSISQIIDPAIDKKQKDRLSAQEVGEFDKQATSALKFFGYEV